MTLREEREREERRLASEQAKEPDKPVILSPEDVSTKLKEHDKKFDGTKGSWIAVTLVMFVMACCIAFLFLHPATTTPKVVHPNTVDSLRADNQELHNELNFIKAHTDTTGLATMRHELNEWRGNAEQLSATAIHLQEAYDRAFYAGTKPKQ